MKTLIIPVLILPALLYGQGKFVTKIYRAQTSGCNVDYSTTYNYVLQVYSDKTVKFDIYTDYYEYMYVRFSKSTFTGKVSISNDTLQISYLSTSFIAFTNYKLLLRQDELPVNKNFAALPPAILIVKNHTAYPANFLLPAMKEIELNELIGFESEFDKWIRKASKKFDMF